MEENKVGRPPKFDSEEDLQNKIDRYFEMCKDEEDPTKWKRPPTVTGLANALDTTRETLLDYEDKDEFSDTIKRAKGIIHQYVEEYLFVGKNQTGAIFNLKNNYNWKEKNETDITSKGNEVKGFNYIVPNENSND